MSYTTTSENAPRSNEGIVSSSKEIHSSKWKFDSIFKLISYIFYGLFFGMIPSALKLGNINTANPIEISSMVSILTIGLISIVTIFWMFKGEIKKSKPIVYYANHLLNAILLSATFITLAFFPIKEISVNQGIETRQFYLFIIVASWALIMFLSTIISFNIFKKQFPLSWSKTKFGAIIFLLTPAIQGFIWASSMANSALNTQQSMLFLLLSLASFALIFILFIFSITYIKIYKDVLLGQKTDQEIQTIQDWENIKVLSIIVSSIASATYLITLIWETQIQINTIPFVDLILNAVIVLVYLVSSIHIKYQIKSNEEKSKKIKRSFKSIDNSLLIDFLIWFVAIKSVILQGFIISGPEQQTMSMIIIASSGFVATVLLYVIYSLVNFNLPNLRNVSSTLPSMIFAIVLVLTQIAFGTTLLLKLNEIPVYLPIIMSSIFVLGASISLVFKTLSISKIFKSKSQGVSAN